MTTVVPGLIKIGKTGTANYKERMRFLEANGYFNVPGLKRFLAVELEDYDDKESLLHEIFGKHRVGTSELFALDEVTVRQLLLSLAGEVIFPASIEKDKEFDEVATIQKQSARFNFYQKGLKNGDIITFISDDSKTAEVIGEREVKFGEDTWKLSPLTRKLFEDRNEQNASGAYQGAAYWLWNEKKLKDLPDVMG